MSKRQERLPIRRTLKQLLIHCLSLSLVLQMLMLIAWPTIAYAAAVNTGVDGLTADSSGKASWNSSNGTITGSVSPSSSSGCTGTTYTAQKGSLTFKNNFGDKATLSFTIEREGNGSSNPDVGDFQKTLNANETQSVTVASGNTDSSETKVRITNLKLVPVTDVTTTFIPPQNGSYNVNDTIVNEPTMKTQSSDIAYSLAATPAIGYKFLRWYNVETNATLSTKASTSLYSLEEQAVTAEFVNAETPVFDVGSTFFTDLNQAVSFAQSNSKNKITLISDGTLPAGDYTIPSGKTLLIPFDEAQTLYTKEPEVVYGSHENPSAFKTLTMADGANITVENGGAISVGSKLSATGTNAGSWNGTPTGKHGRINMSAGSSISLNSGAALYAFGYISGSGSVVANSGSSVWECFQLRCWRGGTATSGMANNSQKVFPMSQYYVQNIEAPLTINAGAEEHVYTAVNASSKAFAASAVFIGSKGMFNNSSGSITKRYEGASDRMTFDIEGDATLQPMSLKIDGLPLIGTLDLNTADYVLPINSNITINVNSGTTILNGQDVALLPSAELNIASGATAEITEGSKLYVYDKDQWGAYAVSGLQLVPVGYSTVNGTAAKRTDAGLEDAKVDISGTLTVNGEFYTTESGAAVISSGRTGKVLQNKAPGTDSETYQATQSGSEMSYVGIPVTAAKLLNSDQSYYETADKPAGTEIPYANGFWGQNSTPIAVTFEKNDANATGEMAALEGNAGEELTLTANAFEYEGHKFIGWNTKADGTGESYADEAEATFNEDTTLYAQWEIGKYTIKFVDDDGTTALQESVVEHGNMPEYTGDVPTKEATAQYTYTFAGWTPEIAAATADATYKATYTAETNKYTVKFVDENGDEIKSDELEYGAAIVAPEAPTKESTAQYTFAFDGWYDGETKLGENDVVVGNATYAPKFTETVNTYTITWNIEGTKTEQTYEYGATPVYSGEEPTKEGGEEFTYTFAGWSPEITTVTGDVEYLAQFNKVKNSYTITFKNEDGTVLQSTEVEYGETPTFNGDTPTKEGTVQYTYTFDGWTPEIEAVTGEATYTAKYSEAVNQYTVKFVSEGVEVSSNTLDYGAAITAPETDPTKESDAQFTYTFDGWYADGVKLSEDATVTGDVTYTAQFSKTTNKYTITFVNEDGTVLQSSKVAYGETPVYNEDAPTKEATAQYTYTFSGWTPEIEPVTGEATYTAKFDETVNKYTITWLDEDGTQLKQEDVAYGEIPASPDTPSKAATAQYTYAFDKWTPEVTEVTGEATYTATYTKEVNTYTITWLNDDGSLINTTIVAYGDMPTHDAPVKDANAQYTYTFTGWSPELAEVTGDAAYTATFSSTTNKYEVKWVDEDGSLLKSEEVEYGVVPVYEDESHATPTKPATDAATYAFVGWDPSVTEVTGDVTYKATYSESGRLYNVVWVDDVLDPETQKPVVLKTAEGVAFNDIPEYEDASHQTPTKAPDAQYTYKFKEWSQTLDRKTLTYTLTAVYDKTVNTYTVKWANEDGTTLEIDESVPYGDMPAYNGENPAKEATAQYTYSFNGWDKTVKPVAGDVTYTATFTETVNEYTITFIGADGQAVDTKTVAYGDTPSTDVVPVKEADAQYTYVFAGWDPEVAAVTGDATYTAKFDKTVNKYTITWVIDNVSETTEVEYGQLPTHADPAKDATAQYTYTFKGWAPDLIEVTGDATYTAQFEPTVNKYTVKFVNDDGTVLQSSEVEYGQIPEYTSDAPTKDATAQYTYTFDGWDGDITAVTGDVTYTATYKETINTYTVIFKGEDGSVLQSSTLEYGVTPEFNGDDPSKPETLVASYTFAGWTPAIEVVTGDVTYTATFDEEAKAGWVEWNGNTYFIADGAPVKGLYTTESLDGTHEGTFVFDSESGVFLSGQNGVYQYGEDYYFTKAGEVQKNKGLTRIIKNGQILYYYFQEDGKAVRNVPEGGQDFWVEKTNGLALPKWGYFFNEDGTIIHNEDTSLYGIHADENGVLCYYIDGVKAHVGMIKIGDYYYYAKSRGNLVVNGSYWCTDVNSTGLEEGTYTFDGQGRMVVEEPDDRTGIFEEDGSLWYYEHGRRTYAGLIEVDGSYYYVRTSGEVVHGQRYWTTKTNDLLPEKSYEFADDGRMVVEEPDDRTGIFEENGSLWYYEHGKRTYAGVFELDGSYYYAKTSGEVVHGQSYWISKTNDLLPEKSYDFADDGKIILPQEPDPSEAKQGIVSEDGSLWWYVDGARTYAGLIEVDGSYYYVRTSGEVVHGKSYWISKTNGLLPEASYEFAEDGKLVQ